MPMLGVHKALQPTAKAAVELDVICKGKESHFGIISINQAIIYLAWSSNYSFCITINES
jgi:hypothetical protein